MNLLLCAEAPCFVEIEWRRSYDLKDEYSHDTVFQTDVSAWRRYLLMMMDVFLDKGLADEMDSSTSKSFVRVLLESTALLTVASALLSFLGATYLSAFYYEFHIQFWTLDLPIYTLPFFSTALFPEFALWIFPLVFLIPWGRLC